MDTLWKNMWHAVRLDESFYRHVADDDSLSAQSTLVVVLSSVGAGLGPLVYGGIPAGIFSAVFHFVVWYAIVFVMYMVGAKWLKESDTNISYNAFVRVMGYAAAPGVIRLLGFAPGIGLLIAKVAFLWILVALIVALRQALQFKSQIRAVIVALISWSIPFLIPVVLKLIGIMGAPETTPM